MDLLNKRKGALAAILLQLLIMTHLSLHAQVTIGSANNPVVGAILDLNNGAAGGLVLSNVNITEPEKIPDGFPGITLENAIAAKAGLTGAIVYNTNTSATCPGVHVWDGKHWERIVSGLPRKSAGNPLSITSDVTNLFGNDEVTFATAPGAKTWTWYVKTDTAAYKYLGSTTEPEFSGIFPDGNHTVKVIADNCRFLEESNEESFAAGKCSPSFGSTAGGNTIYIYGEFSYAATGDYEQSGLVAHYDGINNTGWGDKYHSLSALSWVNLVDPATPLKVSGTPVSAVWEARGWRDDASSAFSTTGIVPDTWPDGNEPRTAEIIYTTPPFELAADAEAVLFRYGPIYSGLADCKKGFYIRYRGEVNESFQPLAIDCDNNFFYNAKTHQPSLYAANTLHTVTSTYAVNMNDMDFTNMLIDGIKVQESLMTRSDAVANTIRGYGQVGLPGILPELSASDFLYHSIRLYNRVLSDEEIARNAALDQKRYIAPPTVTVGDNPCSEVVVLSRNFLMCKVPASTTGSGKKDVVINGVRYRNAYEYVAADAFHISGITPIVGPVAGGIVLTLTGNKLNEITEIRVDEEIYTNMDLAKTNDTCSITLRSHSVGEVDIIITTTGNRYRLAKVFEYN